MHWFRGRRPRVYWPLLLVLAGGALLRAAAMLFTSTAVLTYYNGDSTRYMRLDGSGLFSDPAIPAGYPAFLRGVHHLSAQLPVTVGMQHLFGLGTALLLYLSVRHCEAPRWAALVPATVVGLSGDHVFLEHAVLTESLWLLLLAAGLYAAVRGIDQGVAWLGGAGALLALAAIVRHVAILLPVLIALWAGVAIPGSWRRRLGSGAIVALGALAPIGAYLALATSQHGFPGFTDNTGFQLYGRVAQFANCRRFVPPRRTRVLCQDVPSDRRPGPIFYLFSPKSPLHTGYSGRFPDRQALLGRFARRAIEAQPLEYLRAVLEDEARFFGFRPGPVRAGTGVGPGRMSFGNGIPVGAPARATTQLSIAALYRRRYRSVHVVSARAAGPRALAGYQKLIRVNGAEAILLVVLSVVAVIGTAGPMRAGASAFAICGIYLYAVAPLVNGYDVRYGVPPSALLAAAAAVGIAFIVRQADFGAVRRE